MVKARNKNSTCLPNIEVFRPPSLETTMGQGLTK